MDCQSALTGDSQRVEILDCEQAVFTSISSPMGRGYRLVAASAGITADEKREIVQRSPSHGNLCDAGPEGAGLACFPLTGGRWCILSSWHCELEHTGRGGHRVHTLALILTPSSFASVGYDALRLARFVRSGNDGAIPATNAPLPRLEINLSSIDTIAPTEWTRCNSESGERSLQVAAEIAEAAFAGKRVLVSNAPDDARLLWLLGAFVPPAARTKWCYSAGMKFSPGRDFDLVFTTLRRDEVERIIDEHHYAVIDWNAAAAPAAGANAGWIALAIDACRNGGAADQIRSVATITGADWQPSLAQICRLNSDIKRVASADQNELEEIAAAHRPFVRRNEMQVNLHLKLLSATVQRRNELHAAKVAAEESAPITTPPAP